MGIHQDVSGLRVGHGLTAGQEQSTAGEGATESPETPEGTRPHVRSCSVGISNRDRRQNRAQDVT